MNQRDDCLACSEQARGADEMLKELEGLRQLDLPDRECEYVPLLH